MASITKLLRSRFASAQEWLAAPLRRVPRTPVTTPANQTYLTITNPTATEMALAPWYTMTLDVQANLQLNVRVANNTTGAIVAYKTPVAGGMFEIPTMLTAGQVVTIGSFTAATVDVNITHNIPYLDFT